LKDGVTQAQVARTHDISKSTILRGNIRLIERLMMQVEHVLVANQLQVVIQEVVETARQNLIIGPN
jgi:hypothetical protein